MRRAATIAVFFAACYLAGCASTLQFAADTFGVQIVPQAVRANAFKAADLSFTAWESVQDGFQAYLDAVPLCPPGDSSGKLCRSQSTTDSLKAIQHKTSLAIETLRPAITADSDIDLLLSIPGIVDDAKAALAKENK